MKNMPQQAGEGFGAWAEKEAATCRGLEI